jgi:mannonate dehydratase
MTRRNFIGSAIGTLAAGTTALSADAATPMRKAIEPSRGGIQLSELFALDEAPKIRLASQLGVTRAIVITRPALQSVPRTKYLDKLREIKALFQAAGMTFAGVESHPVPAEKIKLGLPGRDEEIENYIAVIKALAEVGVPLLCYNWMAGLGWYRTRVDLPVRGGALTSEFDRAVAEKEGLTEWGEVSEDRLWRNLDYFLRAVIPVAEQVGVKMALHPDDPPVSPLRGIGRILTSAAAFRRVMNMVPSPMNGITFCQANFKLMGEDLASLIREWTSQKKLFFVHFRDVEGTRERFRETFHDDGPTDMAQMLKIYHECGFDGPMRPDHAPTLEGETNDRPGYSMGGKVFAFGYMKGVMDALGVPYL